MSRTLCQAEDTTGLLKRRVQPKSHKKKNPPRNYKKRLFSHSPLEEKILEEKEAECGVAEAVIMFVKEEVNIDIKLQERGT